ncbi:hypothetical protein A3D78_06020 [Candidatus Gottesmanbacteria bacterium RIFCSPHIGHO2_02_FULL_39_14]|uniref:Triosephosphate isomerase n=2 Tax=Candidatus Gottesmaniibacteriota TaxID=1752720 RepID=A0A1F5ZY63_9BACT|nr:MAG: hypothetical protein A2153_05210 [Candidatus Gottesmanbacteria bacterium RBG_16_38_7b]OGG17409.1 MAG: hypothetical protein A3D78_06020 [Candidatus Gottesmanbacteria bacterium RIFCSPHIGHO2_02_FULL_39_14]
MKQKYLIANWKSNKTTFEVESFFRQLQKKFASRQLTKAVIPVICPVFVHLHLAKLLINQLKLPIFLGAQDTSPFGLGAYTGEVSSSQLKEYISFCIIGHSERRKYFQESDDLLKNKVELAVKWGMEVIFCVPDSLTPIPSQVKIVAYEPVFAIGTGKPDTPENALKVIKEIKMKHNIPYVLYGGSITADNISQYLTQEEINGVLVGGASLDPDHYFRMMINASA